MKTIMLAAVAATIASTAAFATTPMPTPGLKVLAETGWADDRAAEGFGTAYDKTGGMPGAFTYMGTDAMVPGYAAATALLMEGEFLAPHYIQNHDGSVDVMVAPHLLKDGMVMKGANKYKDRFHPCRCRWASLPVTPSPSSKMKNPIARGLRTPRYRVRTVKPKKGKGSYKRWRKK